MRGLSPPSPSRLEEKNGCRTSVGVREYSGAVLNNVDIYRRRKLNIVLRNILSHALSSVVAVVLCIASGCSRV